MSNPILIKPNDIGDYIREAEGDYFHPMHYYTIGNEMSTFEQKNRRNSPPVFIIYLAYPGP